MAPARQASQIDREIMYRKEAKERIERTYIARSKAKSVYAIIFCYAHGLLKISSKHKPTHIA